MNRFALIGVSHRRGGATALESWQAAFNSQHIRELGFEHFVQIATCNRWDTFAVLPNDLLTGVTLQRGSLPVLPAHWIL